MDLSRLSSRFFTRSGNIVNDKANQLFIMLLVVMGLYAIFFGIIDLKLNFKYSSLVNFSMLPVSLLSMYLLHKGFARTAKILTILFVQSVITLHCIMYAPETFISAFYLPIMMCALVILPNKDRYIGYSIALVTILLLFISQFINFPEIAYQISEEELHFQWLLNTGGAAILTALVTIFILRVNQKIQVDLSLQTTEVTKQNEKLELNIRTKNRLFSIISHDLRSPLITIRGAIDVLSREDVPDEKKTILIQELTKRIDNTMVLMDNLLMWSRTQLDGIMYQPELLDPNHLIKGVVKQLGAQAQVKRILILQHCQMTELVNADKNMLELIFRNLISNAIKFTHPDGYVKITIERVANKIQVTVSDSGIGMSPEILNKLRNREFFTRQGTRKEKGTGLGLILCHEFVARNNGELIIDSQPQAGTVISVILNTVEE
jgi:signal transduction histidine kinase